ncbi:MAG: Outer membrane protein assembly factor BamB [Phycisphaerae bacterium]|nr:Outer membrane protein assembly factor BamB [Phycisphaerae bacterium]
MTVKRNSGGWSIALIATAGLLVCTGCQMAGKDPVSAATRARQWHNWRGPEATGATREKAAVTAWEPNDGNVLWKTPIGGMASPIVTDGHVYFITEDPGGDAVHLGERIVCLDADSGRLLWQAHYNVYLTDVVDSRLGWPQMAADPETGYVYAHLTGGELTCLDREGHEVWHQDLTERFGRISGYGGRLHTPVIDEDRVILSFLNSNWGADARGSHRYVALDKRTGRVIWWSAPGGSPEDTTYSMPVVAVIGGVRQLVAPNADGWIYGLEARTGRVLWKFHLSLRGINSSVVVAGKYAYVTHSEENIDNTVMGRVVCIDASGRGDITGSGEVWRADGIAAGYASPSVANGRLYVVDNSALMVCLDAGTGHEYWRYELGRIMKGSPVVTADGVIYVGTVDERFLILRDAGDHADLLSLKTFSGPGGIVNDVSGGPAVLGGRVYLMTRYETYCLGRGAAAAPPEIPAPDAELPPDPAHPATLQITPGEVSVSPGESVRFSARQFDAHGRLLGPVTATWSASGVDGTIAADGTFAAGSGNRFSAGAVKATAGSLVATARVRVCPHLPIAEDFESLKTGVTPPGWIGVIAKSQVTDRDGSRVLCKLAAKERPSPPFMRMQAYIGPPIAGGYTVQADLLGTSIKDGRFIPDMGLINSRYKLRLMGTTLKPVLRVSSWNTQPRLVVDTPIDWKPLVWYRMKFRVQLEADRAVLLGKVWRRDQDEPADWTLRAEDPRPNRTGSPGLYGYSAGTTPKSDGPEIFYDNVKVNSND